MRPDRDYGLSPDHGKMQVQYLDNSGDMTHVVNYDRIWNRYRTCLGRDRCQRLRY
jgi:hypothetical protein